MFENKPVYVAVSGGFDFLHDGHVSYILDAKKLGTELYIFLNTDEWLIDKKGFFFIPYENRKRMLEKLFNPVKIIPVYEVCDALFDYKPNIFAKGGDRTIENLPLSEINICEMLNIKIITGVGGKEKPYSSRLGANNVISAFNNKKIPLGYFFNEKQSIESINGRM